MDSVCGFHHFSNSSIWQNREINKKDQVSWNFTVQHSQNLNFFKQTNKNNNIKLSTYISIKKVGIEELSDEVHKIILSCLLGLWVVIIV